MYTRASASDYDDFQTEGWTTKDLIPVMKKVKYTYKMIHGPELAFTGLSHIGACSNDAIISLKPIKDPATIVSYTVSTAPLRSRSGTIRTR